VSASVEARELQLTAIAGGAALLAGVTLWQLGIECERAWIRSYDSPMLGETALGGLSGSLQETCAPVARRDSTEVERRRWVTNADARRMPHGPRRTRLA
jgi:hypothetical protein